MIETKKLTLEVDTEDNVVVIAYGDLKIEEMHYINGHTEIKIII